VELLLGLVILTEVGIFIRELVELTDKVMQDLLLLVEAVEEGQVALLLLAELEHELFSVDANVAENAAHLRLVGGAHLFPDAKDGGLECILDVAAARWYHGTVGGSATKLRSAAISGHRSLGLLTRGHVSRLAAWGHLDGGLRALLHILGRLVQAW